MSVSNLNAESVCPHCRGNKVVRNGSSRGHRRLLCCTCHRTFYFGAKQPTIPAIRLTQKYTLFKMIAHIPMTLRTSARLLGVSLSTAHRWRNMYLWSLYSSNQLKVYEKLVAFSSNYVNTHIRNKVRKPTDSRPLLTRFTDAIGPCADNFKVNYVVHLIEYVDGDIKRQQTFFAPKSDDLKHTLQYVKAGTPLAWLDGEVYVFNEPNKYPWFTRLKRRETAAGRFALCIRNVFVNWMRSLRGISLANFPLYMAWFNKSWRLILPKYWEYWMPPIPKLLA